jgi:hypothetical protein
MPDTGILHLAFLGILTAFPVLIAVQVIANRRSVSGRFKWARRPVTHLKWTEGPETLESQILSSGNYTIGRSPECHISVNHPSISQFHAVLIVRKRHNTVIDTGSLNRVFVESLPLTAWTVVRVPNGQTVYLGKDVGFELIQLRKK